jgi:hypothetical protein
MTTAPQTGLTPAELATLTVIGEGATAYCGPVPLAHLIVLLKLDLICAEGNGYAPTIAGMYRIVQGD